MDSKYYLNIDNDFFSFPSVIRDYFKSVEEDNFQWSSFLNLLEKAGYLYTKEIKTISDIKNIFNECLTQFKIPEVLNENEECILNVRDVADYFATKELQKKYFDFTIEKYSYELEKLTEENLKILQNFKRK